MVTIYNFFTRAGQIGFTNSVPEQDSPVALPMPGGATVIQIASGEKSGFALLSNGSFASWGYSQKGSLLNRISTTKSEYGPRVRDTTSLGPITRIASFGRCKTPHVVTESGLVYGWGGASTGSLGKLQQSYFISATATSITTWGQGITGVLGSGATPLMQFYPNTTDLSTTLQNRKITSVFAYSNSAGLLTNTGEIYVWGYNNYGMGDGTNTLKSFPTRIVDVDGVVFTKVELTSTVVALTDTGLLYQWGHNEYKKFANNSLTSITQSRPVLLSHPILSNKRFIQAAPSLYAVFVITTDGVLYGWGVNQNAMLGQGVANLTVYADPVALQTGALQTAIPAKVKAYSSGVLVLTTDGMVCNRADYLQS
jgi:alpha-tubulin suppressor-like RCC1 family protein